MDIAMDRTMQADPVALTAQIVAAYVGNHTVPPQELPDIIRSIYATLTRIEIAPVETPVEAAKPAVSVKKSVHPEYLICLEDGKKFKSLKRHLRTQYNMSPEAYREKWGLPPDYPMVAPNYAKARSQLAKEMGLGQNRKSGRI